MTFETNLKQKLTAPFFIFFILISSIFAQNDLNDFVEQVTEESVREWFYRSSDLSWDPLKFHQDKNREEGTEGHDSAKAYIQSTLKNYLGESHVYIDEFPWADGTNGKGYNIIGVKEGSMGANSDIWIVGAHYDSYDMDRTGTAPGANDNGSGIAGVLEMARVINSRESEATIIFAFWDAEEPLYNTHSWVSSSSFGSSSYSGPSGSRAWINDHFTVDINSVTDRVLLWGRIKGNINLDMFGFPAYQNTLWLYHGGSGWNGSIDESGTTYPLAADVNTLYLAAKTYLETYGYDDETPRNYISVIGQGTMQYSDNISFSRAGVPSLEYAESNWSSDTHYHKWSDYYRPASGDEYYSDENPQMKIMTMAIRGALALLVDTAGVALAGDVPLPVELTTFQCESSNGAVCLRWETASETENLGFLIERRQDYEQPWSVICTYLDDNSLVGQGSKSTFSEYCWNDREVSFGQHYEYRISDIDQSGSINLLQTTSVLYRGDLSERNLNVKAYPNPFNPTVTISYTLQEEAVVSVKAYDINGHCIAKLSENEARSPGEHVLSWNADNLPAGFYLVRLDAFRSDRPQSSHILKLLLDK